MRLSIEADREVDGRWIAEIAELPGSWCTGRSTREQAIEAVERLAVDVIADRIAHGELPQSDCKLAFSFKDEHIAAPMCRMPE
jgi:predicted RNase H-like HicB family nuclease